MAEDDFRQDAPVTQVGSAFHRFAEIKTRMYFLLDNPDLARSHPVEYRAELERLDSELKDVFNYENARDAWHWYSQNSNGLGRE
jgi:hypothetical protein